MNQSGSWVAAGSPPRPAAGDVILEGVGELVPDDVIEIGERAADGENDPAPQRLGHAAGAFAEVALDRIGLPELGRAGVEDQRLPPVELVAEEPG